jgi:hypothetical protein
MAIDPIEHYATKINKLAEGIFSRVVGNLFFGGKAKRFFKQVQDISKDDPELQSALAGLDYNVDHIDDLMDSTCKRNPGHPYCKERKRRIGKRRR